MSITTSATPPVIKAASATLLFVVSRQLTRKYSMFCAPAVNKKIFNVFVYC